MSLISGGTTLIHILICVREDIGNEIFYGLSITSIYELLYVIDCAIVPIGGPHVWPHTHIHVVSFMLRGSTSNRAFGLRSCHYLQHTLGQRFPNWGPRTPGGP